MNAEAQSVPAGPPLWRRPRFLASILGLLAIIGLLVFADLDDIGHMPWEEDPCSLHDSEQNNISARMYMHIAPWALRYTPTPYVSILKINSDTRPASLTTNSCESRAFLARLIQQLNKLAVRAIVVDQYFSSDFCSDDEKTSAFIASVQASQVPIVLGQATHAISRANASKGCLALTNPLPIDNAPKLSYGLTRLANDDLRIAFNWPTIDDPQHPVLNQPKSSRYQALNVPGSPSLSFAAALAVEPNIASEDRIPDVLQKHLYPYTTFVSLPETNAMTVMCSADPNPTDYFGKSLADACSSFRNSVSGPDAQSLDLRGKIVVVGMEVPSDMKPFPTGDQPGVYLQASYIQSILDHRFLFEVPPAIVLPCLIAFMIVVYLLYWLHHIDGEPFLTTNQAGVISILLYAGLVIVSMAVLVLWSYYTPLWALWGAGSVVAVRFLDALGDTQGEHVSGHIAHLFRRSPHQAEAAVHNDHTTPASQD